MNKCFYVAVACGAVSLSTFAGSRCEQDTTEGTWMYTCEGSLPAPTQTSTRILGRCTTSKQAIWSCEGTVNLGGQIIAQSLRGQANNVPNCTGTISYAQTLGGAPAGSLDIQYVIFDKGDAISGLPVNSGGILSCSLRRIDKKSD